MARVTLPDGREFDVDDTDTQLLTYYRGEGAKIDGAAPVTDSGQLEEDLVEVPAKSANKDAWVEFAHAVETDETRKAEIDELTKEQLVERYEHFGE